MAENLSDRRTAGRSLPFAAAAVVAFAVGRFGLLDVPGAIASLDMSGYTDLEHIRLSEMTFGIDFVAHAFFAFVAVHGMCLLAWPAYARRPLAPAATLLACAVFFFWAMDFALGTDGPVSDVLDDVLIYSCVPVGIANAALGFRRRTGPERARHAAAGFGALAFMAATALGHAVVVEPSMAFMRQTREWTAREIAGARDVASACRLRGLVCLRTAEGRPATLLSGDGPPLSPAVVSNVLEGLRKYGVDSAGYPPGGRFVVLHKALTTEMGFMRYPGVKTPLPDGSALVVADALVAPTAMAWLHVLFFVTGGGLAILVWTMAIALVDRHHFGRPA